MTPTRRATIKDVAQRAGVSVTTVSNFLCGRERRLNPRTRELVAAAVQELAYRPSVAARALRGQSSRVLGLIIPTILSASMPAIVRGAEDRASESGYSLFLSNVDRHWDKLVTHTSAMIDKGVEAIAYAAWMPGLSDEAMRLARSAGIGVARLVPSADEIEPGCVGLDNTSAMQQAVEHLWNLGHREMAYVTMASATTSGYARQHGLQTALIARGGRLLEDAVCEDQRLTSHFDEWAEVESGHRGGLILLSQTRRPTAVCAMSDMVAVGVMRAAAELKLRVPQDVSIVGFDDTPLARLVQPELTSLAVPRYEVGRTLADILLRGKWNEPGIRVIPELIVRGSTGPAPRRTTRAAGTRPRGPGSRRSAPGGRGPV